MQIPVVEKKVEEAEMPNFASTIVLNRDMLLMELNNIDSKSDQEIYNLVLEYYEDILSDIFENNNISKGSEFTYLFTKPKFIIALIQVMYSVTSPSDTIRKRLNKMCYDYLVAKHTDKDKYVSGLLMQLAKTVNRDKIPKLCALPLPEDLASLLALSRYSSEKEVLNVKRLNRVLMNQPVQSLSEQMIVDIYLALFDHVLALFTGVMLDVVSPQNMTSGTAEIYGLITLAVLDIMNELPIADIKRGLTMFDDDRKIQYPDNSLRINLESFAAEDYPRIYTAMNQLKEEGTYISTS